MDVNVVFEVQFEMDLNRLSDKMYSEGFIIFEVLFELIFFGVFIDENVYEVMNEF